MEMISYKNRDAFLSGDHNPQGIQSLLDILQFYDFRNVHFVVGICADKKHSQMLQKLANCRNSYIYLTETPNKTLYLKDYDEVFRKLAKIVTENPLDALDAAIANAGEDDLVVVTGSLYLIGKIKTLIKVSC
jgi:dihydrofolate synthase/folylpolyglutamate synthase